MDLTGYTPEFESCVKCLKPCESDEIYFSIEQGGIICASCAQDICKKIKIPYKIKEFLSVLLKEDFSVHTKYDDLATEKICNVCINLLKNYIEYYSPKKFKTVKMLESIR